MTEIQIPSRKTICSFLDAASARIDDYLGAAS